jgi:uncharacterized protein YjeT (DUF2065 family)
MKNLIRAAGASLMVVGVSAMAAVPATLTTAITDSQVDTKEVALGMLILAVGILVYKWFRRAL